MTIVSQILYLQLTRFYTEPKMAVRLIKRAEVVVKAITRYIHWKTVVAKRAGPGYMQTKVGHFALAIIEEPFDRIPSFRK